MRALIALEDGTYYWGRSFTGPGEATGEIVFNTGMSGYQEVLTDPSYRGQMVTMTYPLIGNYGVNPEDVESDRIQVSAFLIKEYQPYPSNFRSETSLADYLISQNVLGVEGFDTRALTRHIRLTGAMRAVISTEKTDPEKLVDAAQNSPEMAGQDLVHTVTTHRPYFFADNRCERLPKNSRLDASIWRSGPQTFKVVAFDYGIKFNIIRCLHQTGCEVLVVPASFSADQVKKLAPDGVFLSNGPGDPEPVAYAIDTIRNLLEYRPLFGICLGHQLVGLALDGRTYKLKFGHRGANQPVKNLQTGRIEITSQNHGFAVDTASLAHEKIELTHINLNDNTVEGFRHLSLPIIAVQYHPEASPGPYDAQYLFRSFVDLMKKNK